MMTPENIAAIVEETLNDTTDDLAHVASLIAVVARLTTLVCLDLQKLGIAIKETTPRGGFDAHLLKERIVARIINAEYDARRAA